MTFKSICIAIVAIAVTACCNARNTIEVNYADSSTLLLNKVSVSSITKIQDVTAAIGEPSKIVDYPSGDKSYFYENAGIVIFTKNEKVRGLGINYTWDGDKKFPEKSFTGNVQFGEKPISKATKKEELLTIKATPFGCPIDMLCTSKKRTSKIQCAVAFKDGALSQIVFMLL